MKDFYCFTSSWGLFIFEFRGNTPVVVGWVMGEHRNFILSGIKAWPLSLISILISLRSMFSPSWATTLSALVISGDTLVIASMILVGVYRSGRIFVNYSIGLSCWMRIFFPLTGWHYRQGLGAEDESKTTLAHFRVLLWVPSQAPILWAGGGCVIVKPVAKLLMP